MQPKLTRKILVGRRPYAGGAYKRHEAVVQLLLQKGVNVAAKWVDGVI